MLLAYGFLSFYLCRIVFLILFFPAIFFVGLTLLFDHCYAYLNITAILCTINGVIEINKSNTDTLHFLSVYRFQ